MRRRFSLILVLVISLAWHAGVHAQSSIETDEQTLQNAGLATDTKALLTFFANRSLKDVDRKKIESTTGPELPMAAARILAARSAPGAIETLLRFLPFADGEVQEEVLASLGNLAVTGAKIDPSLQE